MFANGSRILLVADLLFLYLSLRTIYEYFFTYQVPTATAMSNDALLGVCSYCNKFNNRTICVEGLDSSLGKPDSGWTEASLPNVLDNSGMAFLIYFIIFILNNQVFKVIHIYFYIFPIHQVFGKYYDLIHL